MWHVDLPVYERAKPHQAKVPARDILAEKEQRALVGLRHEHSTSTFAKHVHSILMSELII